MNHHTMKTRSVLSLSVLALLMIGAELDAGPLNPPAGPIAPTPGPEPRIAINATNTPGDANSVFRITQPGSYYFTGNMTGQSAKHGIEINANGVTVDLNGFVLVGVAGSLAGVVSDSAAGTGVTLKNGTIHSWGLAGVNFSSSATESCRLDQLVVYGNGATGISVWINTIVTNCVASGNAGSGIGAFTGCLVSNCTARSNTSFGIAGSGGTTVVNCTTTSNTGGGITVSTGSTVIGCTARSNGTWGIATSSSCLVTDCNAGLNTADGISCGGSGCIIRGNLCDSNGNGGNGAGIIVVSVDNKVEGNNCSGNDRGIEVTAAGNMIIRNTCAGNGTNWSIVIGNAVAPIVNAGTNPAAINGNTYAGSLGSTDPNANFTY